MRVILLGTGTDVGKTRVATDLACGLQDLGYPVLALKPIETGFSARDDLAPASGSDAAQLEAVTFHVKQPRPHPRYALSEGISPHLAAERARQRIDLDEVQRWLSEAEQTAGVPAITTLIETAGGLLSPLAVRDGSAVLRNVDLASALAAQLWLLVAPDRLGVLHDVAATLCALTLCALTSSTRTPDCLVLVPPKSPDASTGSNATELRRLHPELPVFAHSPGAADLARWVAARLPH
jgi:dethiobiotin synthetase